MKEMLSTTEVAELFGVGQRTVYRWINSEPPKLVGVRTPGGQWRIPGEQIRHLWESVIENEPPTP